MRETFQSQLSACPRGAAEVQLQENPLHQVSGTKGAERLDITPYQPIVGLEQRCHLSVSVQRGSC